MRLLLIAIVVGAAALVAWTGFVAWSAPSPGPLARPHAEVLAAANGESCDACHGEQGMTPACLDCHTEIADQLQRGAGYHHELRQQGHQDCAACHGDHYGPDFPLVNQRSWQGEGPEGFDHPHVEFQLVAAHRSLDCRDCHQAAHAGDRWPALSGQPRPRSFLGLSQDCRGCHQDVHGLEGTRDCGSCHDQAVFKPASGFDHDASYPLEGAHERTECDRCHRPDPQADVALPFGTTAGKDCRDCHESPHTTPGETVYGDDCAACHDPEVFTEHHYRVAEHAAFRLEGEHAGLDCRACHRELDHPLADLEPATCQSCHADAHGAGGRALRLWGTAECSRCHAGGQWITGTLAEQRHAALEFPLIGGHRNTDCRACHDQVHTQQPPQGQACRACHADPHRASFNQDCNACHALAHEDFTTAAAAFTPEQHAATEFPLVARHRQVGCASCHQPAADVPAYAERFPGREPEVCARCHDDPHAGQFQERGLACANCHTEQAFAPSLWSFEDHRTFPLKGNHQAVACSRCHTAPTPGAPAQFVGTTQQCAACHEDYHGGVFQSGGKPTPCDLCHGFDGWPVTSFDHGRLSDGARCTACHDDPHQGQLTAEVAACQRCHGGFEAWTADRFDHQTMSRYPLDGSHRNVACEKCHPRTRTEDRSVMIRYRPLGRECRDCHEAR